MAHVECAEWTCNASCNAAFLASEYNKIKERVEAARRDAAVSSDEEDNDESEDEVTASSFESHSAREVRDQFAEEHGLSYSGHALKLFKRVWKALIDERVAVVRAEIGDEELFNGGDTAGTGEGATPRYASEGTHASQPADAPVD